MSEFGPIVIYNSNCNDLFADINSKKMNECQKRGCRSLETRCSDCGRLVNQIIMRKEPEWLSMKDSIPNKEQEIMFIAKDGISDERMGWAYPQTLTVLLRRTDIGFEDLLYWLPIPARPNE